MKKINDKENISYSFDISFNMAAIDIGSNGARLLIKNFFRKNGEGEPKISRERMFSLLARFPRNVRRR